MLTARLSLRQEGRTRVEALEEGAEARTVCNLTGTVVFTVVFGDWGSQRNMVPNSVSYRRAKPFLTVRELRFTVRLFL